MAAGATPRDTGMLYKAAAFVGAGVVAAGLGYAFLLYTRKSRSVPDDVIDDSQDMQDQANEFPEKRVLVLGLDNSGKSSLLQVIASHDGHDIPEPTEGFNVMCLQGQDTTLNVWEVGGKQSVRSYWDNFVSNTDVLVFVVDSADVDRFTEAKDELHKLLQDDRLKDVPLVLVANKQDLPSSRRDSDISQALELAGPSKEREIHVVETQTVSDPPNESVQKLKTLMDQLSKKD